MVAYSLGPDLKFCFESGDAIVLDLRRNRYSTVPNGERAALDSLSADIVRKARGEETAPRQAFPSVRARPERALHMPRRPVAPLSARDWRDFALSCVDAEADLRRGRLDLALSQIAAAKAQHISDAGDVASEVQRFVAMRPWWPRQRKCLFDSLALSGFLRRRGAPCDLVFGVRARPFGAHCWLERGVFVLNDTLERALSYVAVAWS